MAAQSSLNQNNNESINRARNTYFIE